MTGVFRRANVRDVVAMLAFGGGVLKVSHVGQPCCYEAGSVKYISDSLHRIGFSCVNKRVTQEISE